MAKSKKEKSSKKIKLDNIIIGVIILVVIIGGGSYYLLNNKPVPKEKNNQIDEPIVQKKVEIIDLDSKTRPYAVTINNIGAARGLQSGLQDAYIIYEFIVEGGLTRYLALFVDAAVERIGSIRSARHYFLDYVLENDAIYVYHGQSPQAQSDFGRLGIDKIVVDHNNNTGWRDRKLNVAIEHTLFTNTEKLSSGLGSKRVERNNDYLLKYSVDSLKLQEIENNQVANNIDIEYSSSMSSSYQYDSETKVYKRSVNNKEHKDYITGEQYTFKNILVYEVANYTISGDTSGRQNLDNIGSGTGYYISEGYAVPITWSKSSRSGRTIYKYVNGDELVINDGNTFIQIQPKNKKLTIN